MKHPGLGFLIFLFLACGCASRINYTPDVSQVKDPISTIKSTLEEQPPSLAYAASNVEVTDERMSFHLVEGGIRSIVSGPSLIVPFILYYKNMGPPVFVKSKGAWRVELYDKLGNDLYWVWTFEEEKAEEFINALHYMIELQKKR